MNKNLLIGVMKMHGDRQSDLAAAIGISLQGLNAKINGKRGADFRRNEIQRIIERYNLDEILVRDIFFADAVS